MGRDPAISPVSALEHAQMSHKHQSHRPTGWPRPRSRARRPNPHPPMRLHGASPFGDERRPPAACRAPSKRCLLPTPAAHDLSVALNPTLCPKSQRRPAAHAPHATAFAPQPSLPSASLPARPPWVVRARPALVKLSAALPCTIPHAARTHIKPALPASIGTHAPRRDTL
ncbi:MAG: hypothetical protein J3K34DRAFT_226748 [Monoraphidium minutum]|nr:MAG: hypothetical protein J3K34DRAFT_226748 [Monoraphidium minutum]